MKSIPQLILFLFLWGCNKKQSSFPQFELLQFRTSYNYGRDFSDTQLDSLKKSKPKSFEEAKSAFWYVQLIKKGIISSDQLDTSNLNFLRVETNTAEKNIGEFHLSFEVNKGSGQRRLTIQKRSKIINIDFDPNILDNRWVTVIDIDNDGRKEVLILEKYYLIGGDNWDLDIIRI